MIIDDSVPAPADPRSPIPPAPPSDPPPGLPAAAHVRRLTDRLGHHVHLLVVPMDGASDSEAGVVDATVAWTAAGQPAFVAGAAPTSLTIPLYGCHAVWAPDRGAVIGAASRIEVLAATVADFTLLERELRELEGRCDRLLGEVEQDAPLAFEFGDRELPRRGELAARFRDAVAVRTRLAAMAPTVHVPPVHPPTLASQLAERLRDRTRLADRHEQMTDRAGFVLQVYEACGQRVAELSIARRQMGLEWAIVAILVAQLALMLVETLASRGGT